MIRLLGWLRSWTSGGAVAPDNEVFITVYGSDVARMAVSGNEAGIVVDGTDTARITINGGV